MASIKLNTTQAERNRELVNDLAKKLKLERSLKIQLRQLFNQIGREFQAVYETSGAVLDTSEYKDEISTILKRHYRKTEKAFKRQLRNGLKESSGKSLQFDLEQKSTDSEIDESLRSFNQLRSAQSADLITNTIQADLNRNVEDVVVDGALNGETLTRKQQAIKAKQRFIANSVSRANTIAITETQAAAENAKLTESNVVLGSVVVAGVSLLVTSEKQWNTILDNRTRPQHASADNQVVGFMQPYSVGGQRLMRPGDTSLGASAWNVVNCRCSSSTIIQT